MRLRDLEIVWAIANHRTMREAANSLGVSQPAVSKALKHAEDLLGFDLFIRAKGRLEPTLELQSLMPDIERVFANVDEIRSRASGVRRSQSGLLRIASIPTLAGNYLSEVVFRLRRLHPRVSLAIAALPTASVVERVLAGEADIGLLHGPVSVPGVRSTTFGENRIVTVLPREHPLIRNRAIGPRDLRNYGVISIGRNTTPGNLIASAFEKANLPFNPVVEVTTSSSAAILVRAGVGVAIVDANALENTAVKDVVVRPFVPPIALAMEALVASGRPLTQAGSSFLRLLRHHFAHRRSARNLEDAPIDDSARSRLALG